MKRILNVTVLTLTAFILLGTVSVMAIERPFALNANGVATFIADEAGNLLTGAFEITIVGDIDF